jgi:hypothetical protein
MASAMTCEMSRTSSFGPSWALFSSCGTLLVVTSLSMQLFRIRSGASPLSTPWVTRA